jgi:hypothetical protein
LESDATVAKSAFRNERLLEPLDLYNQFFITFADIFRGLIDKLPVVAAEPVDAELIASLIDGRNEQKAFRYLTAPPISEDDLETVADATLTASRLRTDADSAKRIRDAVLTIIDPHRFPWVAEGRQPSADERERAVVASAASPRRAMSGPGAAAARRRRRSKRSRTCLPASGCRKSRRRKFPSSRPHQRPATSAARLDWPAHGPMSWRVSRMGA